MTTAKRPARARMVATESLRDHPLSHLVPEMRPSEWREFYRDVTFRGVIMPLEVLADGTVLDGRHRLRAAREAALPTVPVVDALLGDDDPAVYMLKAAVLRRHLNDDQRAMMAAKWAQENKKAPQPGPGRGKKRAANVVRSFKNPTRHEASSMFNVSARKVKDATTVLHDNQDGAEKVLQGEIALKNAHRTVKKKAERKRIEDTPVPAGEYQVLVVDPPWPYSARQNDPSHEGTGIHAYEPESLDSLSARKLPAAEDSILWLWTTNAFLHEAFHLLEAWGFTYHTTLTWVKNGPGLGDWLAGQTEHCLMATRGNYGVFRDKESTALQAKRGRHSVKPDEFYALVDRLCPGTKKLDMYARRQLEGWDVWGADAL